MADNKRAILVVDDDEDFLEAIGVMLNQLGHNDVQTALNGMEALDRIEKTPDAFGLILTDYMMPEMDGLTFIEEINNVDEFRALPKAVVSGYGTPEIVDMAVSLGVKEWFDKPVDHNRLKALLEEAFP